MPSVDERIVSIAFDNTKFEANVAVTMATLAKLETSLSKIGKTQSLGEIDKAASKVKLDGVNTAVDHSVSKFHFLKSTAAQALGNIGSSLFMKKPAGKDAVDELQGKLDKGFNSQKAFADVEASANQVRFDSLHQALASVGGKFSVLAGTAAVAMGNIASSMAMKGVNWAKSFGVGPILDGLKEYQTNLQAIQTVQANTDQPLTKINASLAELNEYSDQTIYNFGEMAKNIGTFTAAGVDLKTATSSIKGIANMAALSGSTSQQAATAMYQLSQAISSGRVGLQDWNSVVNAGMGGKKLQTALVTTGIAMGDVSKNALKFEGPMKKLTINGKSFRESIMAQPGTQSWLSSDILVNTLATLDGRFSKAALSAKLTKDGLRKYTDAQIDASIADERAALEKKNGVKYSDEQFKALMKLSDSSFKAATEVKTLGQVFDVAKETIGSGWSASFQNIFGNLTEAKELFTGMSGAINGFINKTALARNTLLAGWKDLGGRADVIQGLKNIFSVLFDVLGKIGKAFREIFPAKTSQDLADASRKFLIFTAHLNNSPQIIDNIARTFRGFFAVLHIGWSIIKGLGGVLLSLFGAVGKGSGGFLNFTGSIGDFLVAMDKAITEGGLLTNFFDGLKNILKGPVKLLGSVSGFLSGLFRGGAGSGATDFADGVLKVNEALNPAEKLLRDVKRAWNNFKDMLGTIRSSMDPWLTQIANKISNFAGIVKEAIVNTDWQLVFAALETGLLGGMFIYMKKALAGGVGQIGGGLMKNVNNVLGGVTRHLKVMQQEIQANILLKIAAAIALLALAIGLVALIPGEKLAKSMAALGIGLKGLMVMMTFMAKMGAGMGKTNIAAMPVLASSMLILAGALVVLAVAMTIMSKLSWEELTKGLIGLGGALAAVGLGLKFIGPGLMPAALAMVPLALGLTLLVFAVKQLGGMKWEDLIKGLAGISAVLGALALGMAALPLSQMLIAGAGLVLLGVGLNLLAGAVKIFGSIPFDKMLIGLFGIAGSISAIGLAIMLIPPTIALQAAGLVIMGFALQSIAAAMIMMGNLDLLVIIQSLTAIAGVLLIFAVGLTAMAGTLPGAAALLAAGAAFALLAPALALLGNLSWGTIIKGLVAMVLIMGTLAILGPIVAPGLASLAGSIALLGLALIPAAFAVLLFAKGISLLAAEGQKGITVFMTALVAFVASIPGLVITFIKGLGEIILEITKLLPQVATALGLVIDMIIAFVIKSAPKLGLAIDVLINEIINLITKNAPKLIATGLMLIQSLLKGVDQNITQIVTSVGGIITHFLNALTVQAPRIIRAGVLLIVTWLKGISNSLGKIIAVAARVALKFLEGITQQLPKFIQAGYKAIRTFLTSVATQIPATIRAGVRIIIAFMKGIGDAIPELVRAGLRLAKKFLNSIADGLGKLADIGFKAIIRFLNGIERAIRENSDDLIQAGAGIADAIIDAMVSQFGKAGRVLRGAIESVFSLLPGWAKKVLGISSPSKVFMEIGKNVNKGFAVGLLGSVSEIQDAFKGMQAQMKEGIASIKDDIATEKANLAELLQADNPDIEAISRSQDAIKQNEGLLRKTLAAQQQLVYGLRFEKAQLLGLSKQYTDISKKLEEATAVLENAKKVRDDAIASYTDKYATLPSFTDGAAPVDDYRKQLADRIAAVRTYGETLQKLRALGLDDATYRKLVDEGPEGSKFAESLLAGGKSSVDAVNALDSQLQSVSKVFATNASNNLYQAGIDAAQGLVNGLKSKRSDLKDAMEKIATAMIRAIRRKLGIRSPSQMFAEVGKFATLGLARGFDQSSQTATTAAEKLGDNVVSAIQNRMSYLPKVMEGIDVDPTITPVLDLSQVQRESKKLADLTNVTPITAAASYKQAAVISHGQEVSEIKQADRAVEAQAQQMFKFEQNNYSPESLSDVEIYRRTNNQLSQVKTALGVA